MDKKNYQTALYLTLASALVLSSSQVMAETVLNSV